MYAQRTEGRTKMSQGRTETVGGVIPQRITTEHEKKLKVPRDV